MERKGSLRRWGVFLAVSAAYLFPSPYFERLNNPNENVRVWATRAVVAHGVLNIDDVVREWGYVNDKAKNDAHLYSSKAPGVSLLGVPVLFVEMKARAWLGLGPAGKHDTVFWLRLFVVKLPMCAFLWLFGCWVERQTESTFARDLCTVALGLGTMLYPYGGMFAGHAPAAAAAFSAFILMDGDNPRPWRLALAGLLAGAGVVLEYQVLLVAVALAAVALVRYRRRALWFVAGAVPPALALGAYHRALFGKPWSFPYANIENPVFARTAHAAGFHGLSWPHWGAFPAFLFSPAYGLLAFSPILLPGLIGAGWLVAGGPAPGRFRRDGWLVLSVTGAMFLFLAGMSNWRAGWCVGPRYIAAAVPFLFVPIVRLWTEIARRWWAKAALVGLTAASVVLNVVSGAVYPHYPEPLRNPVFQLAFPLLREGYTPEGLGWVLGLRGLASLLPIALVAGGAMAFVAVGGDAPAPARGRLRQAGVAAAIATLFLGVLAAYGRTLNPDERRAVATVRQLWEPCRGSPIAIHGSERVKSALPRPWTSASSFPSTTSAKTWSR